MVRQEHFPWIITFKNFSAALIKRIPSIRKLFGLIARIELSDNNILYASV